MHKVWLFMSRNRINITIFSGLFIILMSLLALYHFTVFRPTTEVRISNKAYSLWLAKTDEQLIQGLSGINKLSSRGGLLMDFGTAGRHGIWMKDMRFPLDIVWLNDDKKVVYIVENAQPEDPVQTVYVPTSPARYVLELTAGSVKKAGIKMESVAQFTIDV